jgi:flagellar hook-associated protein 1
MSNNLFSIGLSGLNAAQWGLTTTGNNISNASTPGYTLEKVSYTEASGQYTSSGYLGNGVQTANVTRQYSQYLTTQVNNTTATSSAASTNYTMLSQLNNLVGDPTTGIATGISNYFSGLQSVANSATSTSARQSLISSAQTLADQITTAGQQYDQLRQSVNTQLTSAVSQINTYTKQISDLNGQITVATAGGQSPNQLMDQRDQAVASLNSLVGVSVVQQSNGAYNVFVGNGQPLVVGNSNYSLQTTTSPSDPSELTVAFASTGNSAQTAANTQYLDENSLSGGTVGGLMDFRNQTLDPAQAKLGAIATSFAAQLNNQNALGVDLNGKAGGALFSTGSPSVYSNARNQGDGAVSVTLADATQPPTSDYTLSYDGANYNVTDSSGKSVGTVTPPSSSVAGMNISVSGTMQKGDSFTIQPTRSSLDNFALATTSTAAIAAGSPAISSAATANAGTGAISSATVTSGYSIPTDIKLTYDSTAGGFTSNVDMSVGSTSYPAGTTIPYDSTTGITVTSNGISATLSGKPSTGDVFNIAANKGGTSDGSNALLMSNLVTAKSMDNGSDTLTGAYANYIDDIGNQTNQAKSTSTSQTALLTQATSAQQSVQGVNLNEEAANLMNYQQLYQANSKVIQIASSLFQTILGAIN